MTISVGFHSINHLMPKAKGQYIFPVMVVLTATIASFAIQATAPVPDAKAAVESSINVSVIKPKAQPFTPSYQGYGTVTAKNSLTLTAQVDGKLIWLAENAIEAGMLTVGETVFQQDDTDLTSILAQRQAQMAIAQARLDLELGQQRIAKKDYQMMKKDFDEKEWEIDLALLLRQPQLAQAQAELTIAKSAVQIAQTDLNRRQWRSDKRYLVVSKQVSQGDYLQKGDEIAKLIEFDTLRIPIYLPRKIAASVKEGQAVSLYQPDTQIRVTAHISQIFPALENSIHLQKVYAEYRLNSAEGRGLIIGDFVEAQFLFSPIDDTLTVPLSAIDEGKVWLVSQDNKLLQKPVTILHQDEFNAVIHNVVESHLLLVINKMHAPQVNLSVNIVERS
jgi:RND family efflux transporter MFP subunit